MPDAKYTVRTKRTKTTTEITVERETFVALRGMRRQRGWCNRCFAETSLITAEEAAAASRVSVSVIYQWAEMGRLHFADANAGQSLVCFGSLQGV
jgi:hypothetical protein